MSVDFKDFARRMEKALEHLSEEFDAVRAGRANAKVLDRITVEYYGSGTVLPLFLLLMPVLLSFSPGTPNC